MNQQAKLMELIEQSSKIVVLSGAGFSTDSGIPDFRSEDGHFKAIREYGYPPETLLSHTFFTEHTDVFFDYYCKNFLVTHIQPNKAHLAVAKLEKMGKLSCVVTQNIDGLHEKAGNKLVFELHGSVYRNYCTKCGKFHDIEFMKKGNKDNRGIPRCECGGIVKPDVVLYEESLPDMAFRKAIECTINADMLIVGGTSLNVYPAAGLVPMYQGNRLVIINKSTTPMDSMANLRIQGGLSENLGIIYDLFQ